MPDRYVLPRCAAHIARAAGRPALALVRALGFNLFCLIAVSGYFMGVTQSKEYAEPEWYADLWLVIVWVTYFLLYVRTLARRKEPHIYVANWYFMAFILVVAILHIINNLAVPISLTMPRATRSGRASRMPWCSGGTGTMPSPSS
jgi:cbb3-type cytochrome oxidase subunit 1